MLVATTAFGHFRSFARVCGASQGGRMEGRSRTDDTGSTLKRLVGSWVWIAIVLLTGCSQSPPRAQPAQITPITLTPGAATPLPLTTADWPMYHANPARTGFAADTPNPQTLTNVWRQAL